MTDLDPEYCPTCSNLAGCGVCPAVEVLVDEPQPPIHCPCCDECRKTCKEE